MALSLDLNPVMRREVAAQPASLDVALSPAVAPDVSAQILATQLDFSELVLPPAALFSQDVSMGRFIASQVTTVASLDVDPEITPLRSIALEYLSTQTSSIPQGVDRIAEARSIIEQMERQNAQRDVELQWRQMLGLTSELPASPAVTLSTRATNSTPSEYESQLNNMLAA